MAGSRRGRRRGRHDNQPVKLVAVAAILIGLVLVSLRLLPGSPLESTAASRWGDSSTAARSDSAADRRPQPPHPGTVPDPAR